MSKISLFHTPRLIEVIVHLCTWSFIFISPLFFHPNFSLEEHIHSFTFPVISCALFYLNYWFLVPRFYQKGEHSPFALLNLFFILLLMGIAMCIREAYPRSLIAISSGVGALYNDSMPSFWWFTLFRNFATYVFIVALAVFIRLSKALKSVEIARKQAEVERKEAELKNLRNQINPHFLLNTLNNIYALTNFNTEKAQEAILELSKLLRYLLYENDDEEVSLQKEIDFLRNYIGLMQIRLPKHVEVETSFTLSENSQSSVAPLIFISLVENAFKHGISSTQPCFVRVSLEGTAECILFTCENSYFPKQSDDKSPGGIGLQQVDRRLELAYPHRHLWEHYLTEDQKTYISKITIYKTRKAP